MMETTKVIPENGESKTWIEIKLKFQIKFLGISKIKHTSFKHSQKYQRNLIVKKQ
jgi:hypothetical protein